MVPADVPEPEVSAALVAKAREFAGSLTPVVNEIRTWAGTVPHPILGSFTAAQWLRFARVHNAHHLAIVDDILAHD